MYQAEGVADAFAEADVVGEEEVGAEGDIKALHLDAFIGVDVLVEDAGDVAGDVGLDMYI